MGTPANRYAPPPPMPPGQNGASGPPQPPGPTMGGPPGPQPSQPPGGPSGPPDAAGAEALRILSGAEGPVADFLKDPTKRAHLRLALEVVKQDPTALQALAQAGFTPDKLQQFAQALGPAPKDVARG